MKAGQCRVRREFFNDLGYVLPTISAPNSCCAAWFASTMRSCRSTIMTGRPTGLTIHHQPVSMAFTTVEATFAPVIPTLGVPGCPELAEAVADRARRRPPERVASD